ncbi:MAG: hypothetical protein AB1411_02475 [Nitrospirota bacterium]
MAQETTQEQRVFFRGPLPGMNDILDTAKAFDGRQHRLKQRWNGYQEIKKSWLRTLVCELRLAKIRPVERAYWLFEWHEPNRLRDPDNVSGAGRKLILDAFVHAQLIPDDGWDVIAGWEDRFVVSRKPGVLVTIREVQEES